MVIVRAAATLALWGIVLATGSLAYIAAMREFVLDNRVPLAFHVCTAALVLGYLAAAGLSRLARRRGPAAAAAWPALAADRHGLILLAASLCALGMSHVDPEFSLKTVREEVPPNLAWIYPAAAFLAPLWIRRTAARVDAADQALLMTIGATLLSGALCFVPAHLALGLGILSVLLRLKAGARRLALRPTFIAALLTVLGLLAATIHARNRYLAEPSMAWIGSAAAIGFAISLAPRDRGAWLRLLAVPVFIASVIAVCDVLLTLKLGFLIAFPSALDTRLVLFRQHPNFLAPFFVFHAVLAVGLGLCRARWSLLAWPALALLVYACWHTDSNTGKAALLLGLGAIPVLYALRCAWRAFGGRRVAALLALLVFLCAAGGWFAFWSHAGQRWLSSKIDRFEKSIDYRADAWVNSLKVIRQAPWLGIGPHNFIAVERFKPGSRFAAEEEAPHPHNMLLYMAQSAGVCTLLAASAWIVFLLLRLLLEAVRPRADLPVALPVALVAAGLALLAANQFDLGLALDTVVPFPFFLMTGLVLAQGAQERRTFQPGQALALAALVLAPAWSFVSEPLCAMIRVRQAQILSFEYKFNADPEGSLERAKELLREAIRRSPVVEEAHDVLARLQGSDPEAQAVIESLIAVAPDVPFGHSLLGTYHWRQKNFAEAALAHHAAAEAAAGGPALNVDRAREIVCLAITGEVPAAQARLEEAIRIDRGVVDLIPWTRDGRDSIYVPDEVVPRDEDVELAPLLPGAPAEAGAAEVEEVGGARARRLSLLKAVQAVWERNRADQEAGREVGRRFWLDTFHLAKKAKRYDLAREILAYFERKVPEIEGHTIAGELALVELEEGHLDQAVAQFNKAYELSRHQSYLFRAQQVLRQTDATHKTEELVTTRVELTKIGDMAALTEDYRVALDEWAASLAAEKRFVEAAEKQLMTLFFREDCEERVKVLEQAGILYRQAGEALPRSAGAREALLRRSRDALVEALRHLFSKPAHEAQIQEDLVTSAPARVAAELVQLWTVQGLSKAEMLQEAEELPHALSCHLNPSHFRIGLYRCLERHDLLLREADLLLKQTPDSMLAKRARVTALTTLGRTRELPAARRALLVPAEEQEEGPNHRPSGR